eukprot:gnl/MRDRNA2_/MRDRNA2_90865_c0_seq1.p1 gnl/MRDRNA2_/MRDRNA2_90865_c0~~gnl/MRDRNA2_/MRDRNA2_90865_c0_seq1.p1  ORF type:complete len:440 (-),score=106.18 gnl/MRDRNA2_/MRDRNA2_90865_c0_seq1:60-1379(-)
MAAIKLLLLSIMTSLVQSHFLPIKEDPADALVDKMVAGAGIDSADSTFGPAMSWKKPALPDETPKAEKDHKRFNQRDLVKFQPVVSATGLVPPKEWESAPETETPSSKGTQHEPVQAVLAKNQKLPEQLKAEFYHEIVSKHQSPSETDDGEMSQKSISSTVEQELQNLKPKEAIKVFHGDTKLHETAYSGLAHLGESLDKYGPLKQQQSIDPNFSVHHGSFRPTTAPTFQLSTTTESMVADTKDETRSLPKQVKEDDLTSSLKAMFPKQKNVALKPPLTDKISTDKVPGHSVMDSVHHSKRSAMRFPIRAEDVRYGESSPPKANSTSQSHLNSSIASTVTDPVKQHDPKPAAKLAGHRSKPSSKKSMHTPSDKLTNLFNANSDAGGQLSANDVEKVLTFMKVQSGWNWHPFDLNGDGKLSRQEFMNAARVAQHFKISQK